MPAATISSATTTATLTQAKTVAAIKTGMASAGFTLAVDTPGTSYVMWFTRVLNAGATYGTVAVRFTIDSTGASINLAFSYSTTGNLVTTGLAGLTLSSDLTVVAINHSEVFGIILKQGTTIQRIMFYRPAYKHAAWNENNYLYCFWSINGTNLNVFSQPTALSLGGVGFLQPVSSANGQNPFNGNAYEIYARVGITSGGAYLGDFSADIVFATRPSGNIITDILDYNSGAEQYTIIDSYNAIRSL